MRVAEHGRLPGLERSCWQIDQPGKYDTPVGTGVERFLTKSALVLDESRVVGSGSVHAPKIGYGRRRQTVRDASSACRASPVDYVVSSLENENRVAWRAVSDWAQKENWPTPGGAYVGQLHGPGCM